MFIKITSTNEQVMIINSDKIITIENHQAVGCWLRIEGNINAIWVKESLKELWAMLNCDWVDIEELREKLDAKLQQLICSN